MSIAMRRWVPFKALALFVIIGFLSLCLSPGYALAAAARVLVPAGTPVELKLTETVSPETKGVGDPVGMTVARDVVVDGKVVIKSGAEATGEVMKSKKRSYFGIPAKVGVSAKWVKAVDGSSIMLSGATRREGSSHMVASIGLSLVVCLLFALWKGGEAEIPAGASITATTGVSAEVSVP